MSFQNANLQIQKNLYNRAGQDTRYKIIDALMAARIQNNSITEADFGYSPGKERQLKVNYYPVICDTEGDCSANVCDDGTALAPKQTIFEIGHCTASQVYSLAVDDIRQTDDDLQFSGHALAQIASVLDGVRKSLAQDMAAILRANVGCLPDGSPDRRLALTDPANGAVRPLGLWQIEQAFEDAGMPSPFIVGGSDVFTWMKATEVGGLNAQGQNTGAFNNNRMFYDKLVESAFSDPTTGHIIAFDPKMLRLVTFSRNAEMFATDWTGFEDMDRQFKESKNGKIKGAFLDPVTGLIWDLDIKYEDCANEHWTFQLRLVWDIFFLPDYACNLPCVTGIFHFTTCLPQAVDCGTPEPVTPVTPSLYEWDPTFAYPKYVGELTLAGQKTMPNVSVANDTELVALLNSSINGYSFSLAGTDVRYTGYSGISGDLNNGEVAISFGVATT